MAKNRVSESVTLEGADEARKKLRGLDKTANAELRLKARAIVDDVTPELKTAGQGSDRQSALVAGVIRTRSDRFPTIVAGGSKKLRTGKDAPRAGQLFFGAEFGGQRRKSTQQFREHKGRTGYWFWPTIRRHEDQIGKRWLEAVDEVVEEATR